MSLSRATSQHQNIFNMERFFNYSSIEDKDFTVTVLSNSTSGDHEECYIQDLLVKAAQDKISRLIVSIKNENFILYTVQVPETSLSTIEDAVATLDQFVRSGRSSVSTFYRIDTNFSESHQKVDTCTCMTTISRARGTFFESLSLPIADSELLKSLESHKRQSVREKFRSLLKFAGQSWKDHLIVRVLFWSAIAALCIFAAAISQGHFHKTFHQYYENGIWVRYDLKASQGPKYQLQFTHHNASSWAAKNPHDNGEWAFRIDDQAMIPAHLMDEEEMLYQRWFQKRYPEKNQVRLNQDYIKDSWLGDPDKIQVPSDKQFHMAHCVRALRRYWQAKETGKHVCPRDIDYRHMKHCLDSMDEWAFPDGERGSIKPVVDSGTWKLIWETKVCF